MGEDPTLESFRRLVLARGAELYRDLPWRRTRDPYQVWISEVMLQQTQVTRVDGRWQRWVELFPTPDALAAADSADVLEEWQGMGYNRRALSLWKAAGMVSARGGQMPRAYADLLALPGIGPATAAGIRAFSYNLPGVYLETNVRSVFIHELYPDAVDVTDRELLPLVERSCPMDDSSTTVRTSSERCPTPRAAPPPMCASPSSRGAIARSARRSFASCWPIARTPEVVRALPPSPTSWASGRREGGGRAFRSRTWSRSSRSWPKRVFAACATVSGLHRQWRVLR